MVLPNNVPVFFSAPPPPRFPKLKDMSSPCPSMYAL